MTKRSLPRSFEKVLCKGTWTSDFLFFKVSSPNLADRAKVSQLPSTQRDEQQYVPRRLPPSGEQYSASQSPPQPARNHPRSHHHEPNDTDPPHDDDSDAEVEGMFWGGRSFTITSMDDRKPTHGRASSIYEQLLIERSVSRASGEDTPSDDDGAGKTRRMPSRTASLYSEEDAVPQRLSVASRASVPRRAPAATAEHRQVSNPGNLSDEDAIEWKRRGTSRPLSLYSEEDTAAQSPSAGIRPVPEKPAPDAPPQYRRQSDENTEGLRRPVAVGRSAADKNARDDRPGDETVDPRGPPRSSSSKYARDDALRRQDDPIPATERRSRPAPNAHESRTPYRQSDAEVLPPRVSKSDLPAQRPSSPSSSLQLPAQPRQRRSSDIPKEPQSWVGTSVKRQISIRFDLGDDREENSYPRQQQQDEYPEDSDDDHAEAMRLKTRSLPRRKPSALRSSTREQEASYRAESKERTRRYVQEQLHERHVDPRATERESYAEQQRGARYAEPRSVERGERYGSREEPLAYRGNADARIRGSQHGPSERDAVDRHDRLHGRDRADHGSEVSHTRPAIRSYR
ncbi:hypothetical protein BJ742DRAFT_834159 [Cladochytrium replicatum]|nr:hypothetical protein BJ742DRAFT_834159 [Cladochytrium replicatum]